MGFCRYAYNPSELYRRTRPGTAPEIVCGARTFPAADEPEVIVVRAGMGPDGAIYEYRPSGRLTTRAQDDPYCPEHGGSPAPPPPPVTLADLEYAYAAYQELAARYQDQPGAAVAAAGPAPAELTAPPAAAAGLAPPPQLPDTVSAGDLDEARQAFQDLIDRARQEGAAK